MCKYCWHPSGLVLPHSVVVEDVPHNPGCPVIEGNFEDWQKGADWGWNNSTAYWRNYPKGQSPAFYMGVRQGKDNMEGLVQNAIENKYF